MGRWVVVEAGVVGHEAVRRTIARSQMCGKGGGGHRIHLILVGAGRERVCAYPTSFLSLSTGPTSTTLRLLSQSLITFHTITP